MNCDAIRRRLLSDEHPHDPADHEVRRHLGACSPCRAVARRLALVESRLPQLPVPPSAAKAAFVRRFVRTGGPVVRRVPLAWPTPAKERGLRKLSLAVAIAAMLAFLTIALWSWPYVAPPPARHESPLVAEIQKKRDRIHGLPESEQAPALTALASDLREQVRALTEAGDDEGLAGLATVYGEVVRDDLLPHARRAPPADRAAVLKDAAEELVRAESEFARLAAEKRGLAGGESLAALQRAAADGSRDLQNLRRTS